VRLSDQQRLVAADTAYWLETLGANDGRHGLHSLLYAFREFRALYYHRLSSGNGAGALAAYLARSIWRPTETLTIDTAEIGPGLFIAHGQGSCLAAAKIGSRCHVHQWVTIGWDYKSDGLPIIGDDVFIGAGAVILGKVTIGDGARIGANAVVIDDVPAGTTAVGAPARRVVGRSTSEARVRLLGL
jgi:serine O-acetyltransferase